MLDEVLNVFFPARCFGCGVYLLTCERPNRCCAACEHTVHRVESPRCTICALPREARTGIDEVCRSCLTRRPQFSTVRALWIYDGAVADAIRRAKVGGDPSSLLALIDRDREALVAIASELAGRRWTTPPMHHRDLVRRGWDPSRTALQHALRGLVTRSQPLIKVRRTIKQARLGADARAATMRRAFDCSSPVEGEWVVFDDVMTTGSTLNEASRALRAAGAADVIGVVLARTV